MIPASVTEKGEIVLDFRDIVRSLCREDKLLLAEDLACDDVIIQHVVDQITEGYTENRCSGGAFFPARSDGGKELALDKARRQIVKELDLVSGGVIERLERSIKWHEDQAEERRKEAERKFYARQP